MIRRLVLLGGSLQVAGAVALTTGVLVLAGVEPRPALCRTSFGLLIFRDLAVVAMVLLLPVLGGGEDAGGGPLVRALLTALAGVSVSLGAFLAGLVVSESRHSAHALGEVLPLQILFPPPSSCRSGPCWTHHALLGARYADRVRWPTGSAH